MLLGYFLLSVSSVREAIVRLKCVPVSIVVDTCVRVHGFSGSGVGVAVCIFECVHTAQLCAGSDRRHNWYWVSQFH